MMKFIIASLFLIGFAAALQNYNIEDVRLFGEFMRNYEKKYENTKEFNMRFAIFSKNLREIERLNKESRGAQYNITKFSDMSKEEFRKYPCGVNKLSDLNDKRPGFVPNMNTEPTIVDPNLPVSFDWTTKGAVTPVKDQQQCGSCWAFSVIGNAEGVHFLAGNKLVGLSEEQLVSCSTTDYGCSGGWPFWAWTDMLATPYSGRLDTESGYPYTSGGGDNGVCKFGTKDVGAAFSKYTSYCTEQTAACSETDMQQWLVSYGPLSVCLDAGPMQFYQGGVDNPTDCDPTQIDHCVTMVGYGVDNGTPFWRIKNSWNTNWGEQGYYRLIRGTGACGINKVITVATAKK